MLPITPVARVIVTTVRASASPASFDTGLLLVRDPAFAEDRRLAVCDGSAAALETLTGWGFSADSDPYRSAILYFAASPAPTRLLLSAFPAAETLPEALTAVLAKTAAFYGVCAAQEETDDSLLLLDAFISGLDQPLMLFLPVTGTPEEAAADGGRLAALHARSAKRAVPLYGDDIAAAAALMGCAMGQDLSHPASTFSLCYKKLSGVTPSDLTEAQAEAIRSLGGNVYLTRGYTHLLLERGTVASGLRYDEVYYLDEIAGALQTAAVTLLADNPDKLPQTDDTTARFMNRFTSILMTYLDRGVLAPGPWRGANVGPLTTGDPVESGFLLWADSYDNQSDADRAAHKAVPINAALVLAGSVESIVLSVNVTV